MQITLEIPDSVLSLLGDDPKRTIHKAIKAHLAKRGRPITNAERDAAIADKAVAGVRQYIIAKEYGLSIIRVSQIVAQGKADAYARLQEATNARIRNTLDFDHL
jgi:hypothetical protein